MKRFLSFLSIAAVSLSTLAQVTIPFDVPMPKWKKLVTPNSSGQLFSEPNFTSDILICIEGPEYDTYEWYKQSHKPLSDGESSFSLFEGNILAVISEEHDFMYELEFCTYASGIFQGYSQSYGFDDVNVTPLTPKDLEDFSEAVCFKGNDGNIYVILSRGSEEHFGWAVTFYIGRLKEGYVVCPYVCTVKRNIESNHPGILNGKLGDCDLSKFTMRDAEYILKHAEPIDDNEYCVMYGMNSTDGRRVNWLTSRLLGSHTKEEVLTRTDDNQIYTQVEQEPTYPGGLVTLLKDLAQNIRYPMIAAENNVQGKVVVRFIIEKDGSITNPEVIKTVDPDLDREALRVVKKLGKMSSPGKINGHAVRSYYSVPLNFKL